MNGQLFDKAPIAGSAELVEYSHQGFKVLFTPFFWAGGDLSQRRDLRNRCAYDQTASDSLLTAKDPILFEGGDVDLFGYCLNNPISFSDPDGLEVFYHGNIVNVQMSRQLERLSKATGHDIHLTEEGGTRKNINSPRSQHYTGNAADFYMTTKTGEMVPMACAAYATADFGGFSGIGYYSGEGPHGAHIHADLRSGRQLYWSETDDTGYHYNNDSAFWRNYFQSRATRRRSN